MNLIEQNSLFTSISIWNAARTKSGNYTQDLPEGGV